MADNKRGSQAVILCPADSWVEHRLLGLTIGERLLLSLAASGLDKVAFAGVGSRPESKRAAIEVVELADIDRQERVLLLAADVVFDKGAWADRPRSDEVSPICLVPGADLESLLADADAWLSKRSPGMAGSGPGFAIRVGDKNSARVARRSLLDSLRKPIDGFVSRHLNRHLSLSLTPLLIRTGWRPNTFTVIFALVGVASGVMAVFAEYWWALVAAGLLFQAQSVLDGCDGEMARLTFRFSHIGQWLDSIGDDLTNYLFCLGLALGQARVSGQCWLYVFGGLTFIFQWAASGINYRRMIVMGTGDLLAIPDTVTTSNETFFGKFMGFMRMLSKRDVFVFIVAAFTVAQLPLVAFFVFAGGTYPTFLGVLVNDIRVSRMTAGGKSVKAA
ncbi:MAG TPA: CDP-alcohol phosphatidyltransferase family protein [Myxococcota bacterium]|nr:CDP-alcohol phosphatidyltransferase family protein [Myxococcota bacterium]